MGDDIVTRLMERCEGGGVTREVMREAADEIRRLRADKARYAEMLRIKDDLINAQVRKIMHLSGVKG